MPENQPHEAPITAGEFPILFHASPENALNRQQLLRNESFVTSLIPPQPDGGGYSDLDQLTIRTCVRALTEADYKFGRNTGELGELQSRQPEGIWAKFAMPTFYHNGDGTRLAMLGTANYMDFVNNSDPDSPYKDRQTYLASLLTAAYDDIVFGEYGRGGDERRSMAVARMHMEQQGFPADMIEAVSVGIEASIFNEKTGQQNFDPSKGYEAVQVAANVGDLWGLGTPIGTLNAATLVVENLWKLDKKDDYDQVLRRYARSQPEWRARQGKRLKDYLALVQQDPASYHHFGKFFYSNEKFLTELHRYPDARIDNLMRAGKEQNGLLHGHIGRLILNGEIDVHEGFRCAVGYASIAEKHAKGEPFSDDRMERVHRLNLLPQMISRLALRRWGLATIRQPLSTDDYVERYLKTLR